MYYVTNVLYDVLYVCNNDSSCSPIGHCNLKQGINIIIIIIIIYVYIIFHDI